LDRVRSAILIPIIVFPCAAVVAIAIGLLLHLVKDITCDEVCEEAQRAHQAVAFLGAFATPLVALLLVVIITAAGFVISGLGPKEHA
jgi:di/tricarboxylate transporter